MTFVEANVLLELLLPGRKNTLAAKEALAKTTETAITTLTIHLLYHFCRKADVDDQLVRNLIAESEVIDLRASDYYWARDNEKGRGFEDALQVAAAIRSDCEQFITIDQKLAKHYESYIKFTVITNR